MDRLKEVELLYVEDDDQTRRFISTILRRRFKSIHTAENGEAGLQLFKEHKAPLIITDIRMPVMDGVEMIRHIREDMGASPLVMVTTAHTEKELHSPHADIHLFKPIDINQLLQTAQRLLLQAGKI